MAVIYSVGLFNLTINFNTMNMTIVLLHNDDDNTTTTLILLLTMMMVR